MTDEELEKVRTKLKVKNPELKSSIGLYNINERIKLCYGEGYGMQIESVLGEGTSISIEIPASMATQV